MFVFNILNSKKIVFNNKFYSGKKSIQINTVAEYKQFYNFLIKNKIKFSVKKGKNLIKYSSFSVVATNSKLGLSLTLT